MPPKVLRLMRSSDGAVWAEAMVGDELWLNGRPLEDRAALEAGDVLVLRRTSFVAR